MIKEVQNIFGKPKISTKINLESSKRLKIKF